jgi:hypothetical protein
MDAIQHSQVMVIIFSSMSNASPHVMREVERAVHYGVTIIPVRIEDALPSGDMEYFLSTVHWLDAMTEPREQQLAMLTRRVERILKNDADPEKAEENAAFQQRAATPVRREATALGRWIVRDRGLSGSMLILALLPLLMDFVLHLHIAPPWPDRLAVVLLTGVISSSTLGFTYVAGKGLTLVRLWSWLRRGLLALASSGVVFLILRASVVWNAPTPHDQEVGGFLLRPSIEHLMNSEEITIQDALIGYESDPTNVWVLWTVVVSRVSLLVSWVGLIGSLSIIVAIFVIMIGLNAPWPEAD